MTKKEFIQYCDENIEKCRNRSIPDAEFRQYLFNVVEAIYNYTKQLHNEWIDNDIVLKCRHYRITLAELHFSRFSDEKLCNAIGMFKTNPVWAKSLSRAEKIKYCVIAFRLTMK
jgi:hypothetical protein